MGPHIWCSITSSCVPSSSLAPSFTLGKHNNRSYASKIVSFLKQQLRWIQREVSAANGLSARCSYRGSGFSSRSPHPTSDDSQLLVSPVSRGSKVVFQSECTGQKGPNRQSHLHIKMGKSGSCRSLAGSLLPWEVLCLLLVRAAWPPWELPRGLPELG